MVLLFDAAAGAGILDGLPATSGDVAARLGRDEHACRVVLDALAVWDVVEVGVDGAYAVAPTAPDQHQAAALRHHAAAIRRWSNELVDRLRGETPPGGRAMSLPLEPWLDALAVYARPLVPLVADVCLERVPGARRSLDLGGGHGELALELARRGLHVTMQDRPEVVELARQRGALESAGVELFAGDFFERLPDERFDVVLCAGVTHTFDGPGNRRLYRSLAPIVAKGGGFAIQTFLRSHRPAASVFATQMLVAGRGGDSHGEEDYATWLRDAGFTSPEVVHLRGRPESVLFAAPISAEST
jgi:SAM-dependent methyltransferase